MIEESSEVVDESRAEVGWHMKEESKLEEFPNIDDDGSIFIVGKDFIVSFSLLVPFQIWV